MINTLDLDQITKEQLNRIKLKISKCPFSISEPKITDKPSDKKGIHVIIECSKLCDNCRFVFDDPKRYDCDFNMPLRLRDFLFAEKHYFGNLPITQENLNKIKEIQI